MVEPHALAIQHGFNFRDLGGYQTKAGGTIQSHRLIRAGRLSELTPDDQAYLADYGLHIDVDFRSPQERADAPDRIPADVDYEFAPVFPTDETKVSESIKELRTHYSTDPLAGFKNMRNTYMDIVNQPSAKKAYRRFFDLLLTNTTGALLFHCSAGKDRTGMAAVYLLTVLGVDPVTIRQDYLASNRFLAQEQERMQAQVRASHGSEALAATTRSLGAVSNEYLDAAMLTINRHYGSLAAYLEDDLGINASQRRQLRQLYLA